MNEIDRLQQLAGIVNEDDVARDAGDINSDKVAVGHVDNERDMIRRELFQMGKYCVELFGMLSKMPDSDFPHWWQSKVIRASEHISQAKHYLENNIEVPSGDDMGADGSQDDRKISPDVMDNDDPSGVS